MNRSEIRGTLDEESVRLSKALGQNLLHDQNVLRRIAQAADLQPDDQALEIGPGLGGLTEHLLASVRELTAIEKDKRLHEHLRDRFANEPKLRLIHVDALRYFTNRDVDWTDWAD